MQLFIGFDTAIYATLLVSLHAWVSSELYLGPRTLVDIKACLVGARERDQKETVVPVSSLFGSNKLSNLHMWSACEV